MECVLSARAVAKWSLVLHGSFISHTLGSVPLSADEYHGAGGWFTKTGLIDAIAPPLFG